MSVYKISKKLLNFLASCPKDENTGGITEWNKEEQDEKVKKELLKIISSFSYLVWGYDSYNPVYENITKKEKYLNKEIEKVKKWLNDNPNEDKDKRWMMENELRTLEMKLNGIQEEFVITPNRNAPFPCIEVKASSDYEKENLLSICNIYACNRNLVITLKEKITPNIQFRIEERKYDGIEKKTEILYIDDKEIKMQPHQKALYEHFKIQNENTNYDGETTSELCDSSELNKIYKVIKSSHNEFPTEKDFFNGENENPKKNITNAINDINKTLKEQYVKPHYCIKQTKENGKGEKFNVALYEINRETE
ncbi:MAG: hypothetical protein MJ198_08405 [Bacteroidales bacterium]|nr:hypothetical protein [Bacteroidales bacterium]